MTEENTKAQRNLRIAIAVLLAVLIALAIWLWRLLQRNPEAVYVDRTDLGISVELVLGGPGEGDKPKFDRPMGVAWAPDGRKFYVADSENDRICLFDDAGRYLGEFGGFGVAKPLPGAEMSWNPGELNYPIDVAVDSDGNVYVADFYNDSISVFSSQGRFIRRFPEPDTATGRGGSGQDGLGIAVTAVAVSGDRVYATDSYQIFVFSRDGKLLQQVGRPGTGKGEFNRPTGIAVGSDGTIVVADSNNNRVQGFDSGFKPLWVLGGGVEYTSEWEMSLPRGIAAVGADRFLVADTIASRLVMLSADGRSLARLGGRGVEPARMSYPNDVAWADGRILIADRENNRVQLGRVVRQVW